MAGRRPKPTALKIVSGNPGKRKLNAQEPEAAIGTPAMPNHLTKRAKEAWERIAPELEAMRVLTLPDGPALELLCDAYAEWRAARAVVTKRGATYRAFTKNGYMMRVRPEVAIASDAWRRIKAMLVEFGLTPAARSKVNAQPEQAVDPFESFLGQKKA